MNIGWTRMEEPVLMSKPLHQYYDTVYRVPVQSSNLCMCTFYQLELCFGCVYYELCCQIIDTLAAHLQTSFIKKHSRYTPYVKLRKGTGLSFSHKFNFQSDSSDLFVWDCMLNLISIIPTGYKTNCAGDGWMTWRELADIVVYEVFIIMQSVTLAYSATSLNEHFVKKLG